MSRINWEEEFDKVDAENTKRIHEIRILKLQDMICKVAKNCENENTLREMIGFCAGMAGMRFVDNFYDMHVETERTVAV